MKRAFKLLSMEAKLFLLTTLSVSLSVHLSIAVGPNRLGLVARVADPDPVNWTSQSVFYFDYVLCGRNEIITKKGKGKQGKEEGNKRGKGR